jgi:hypothetical protein
METVFLISIIMLTGGTGLALGAFIGTAIKR